MSVMSYIASKRKNLFKSTFIKKIKFSMLKSILWNITVAFTEFNNKEDHENIRLNNTNLKGNSTIII